MCTSNTKNRNNSVAALNLQQFAYINRNGKGQDIPTSSNQGNVDYNN